MLLTVSTNIEDVSTLSAREQDKKLKKKLFDLNETLLKDVIAVFTPFDTAAKHLSTDKECSLHMVTDANIIKEFFNLLENSVSTFYLNNMLKRYFPIN